MLYKRILVAVDGSMTSELALIQATRLAKEQKSSLFIVNVVNEYNDHELIIYNIDPTQYDRELTDEGHKILNKMQTIAEEMGVHAKTALLEIRSRKDRIAEEIILAVKHFKADLLVVGTHGRRGFSHFFLGSVAENVIWIAPIPVLLFRSKEEDKKIK